MEKHKISTGTDIRDVHRYPEIFTDIDTDVGTHIRDIHRYRVAQIPGIPREFLSAWFHSNFVSLGLG